jgi:hypothetical protein
MPSNHKGGRSLGRLFGHRKENGGKSILLRNKNVKDGETSEGMQMGVTRKDIIWDPQGRILNWKSVVSKIQKQVRVTDIYKLSIDQVVMYDVIYCTGYREG